jgi:hypothetical protein
MKIFEFKEQYDLHDSLVEKIYNSNGKLILDIDLCNWRQKDYKETEDEMKMIRLCFQNVKDYSFDGSSEEVDSDTILKFDSMPNQVYSNNMESVKFVLEGEDSIKIIQFVSGEVDITD